MKSHVRAAVIGGGVVGCSVLYHLTRAGWRDVVLIERSELTSGSTWHAAGGFHTLNADTNMAALQGYTISLYRELEELTGQSCGLHHVGGVTIATTEDRLDFLRAERAKHRYMGLDTEIVGPSEIKALSPITNVDGVLGALYDPLDGHLDPSGTTHAYAKAARMNGAEIYLRNRVLELEPKADGKWEVSHRAGDPHRGARRQRGGVVGARGRGDGGNLAPLPADGAPVFRERRHPRGLRARTGAAPRDGPRGRELPAPGGARSRARGLRAGLRGVGALLHPLGLRTRTAARQAGAHGRQAGRRVRALSLPGACRRQAHHQRPLHLRPRRQPAGRPRPRTAHLLVRLRGDGGIQARAVGSGSRSRSGWWRASPRADVFAMDVARFGDWCTRPYTRAKVRENYQRRFAIGYPNEELPAGRPLVTTPAYGAWQAENAVFGAGYGLEHVNYFAPPGEPAFEVPSFRRSKRLCAGRGGMRGGARCGRHQRDPQLRQVRGERIGVGGLAVAHHGGAGAAGWVASCSPPC